MNVAHARIRSVADIHVKTRLLATCVSFVNSHPPAGVFEQADPDTFSPVQRVVWQSRPANGNGGCSAAPIVNPADCDHSAVKLSFGGGYKNRGRKKGKHSGKPSVECTKNVTGTVKTDEAECKTLPTDDSQAPEEASPPGVASRDAAEGGEEESEMQAIMGFSEFGACSQ